MSLRVAGFFLLPFIITLQLSNIMGTFNLTLSVLLRLCTVLSITMVIW